MAASPKKRRVLMKMNLIDYGQYYYLERYLFGEVNARFRTKRRLTAFDFFCIVIWKANRSKSTIAERLLSSGKSSSYQTAVNALVRDVVKAKNKEARLRVLLEGWQFRLPMASAILTVLYPHQFTVYDVRVCEILNMPKEHRYATAFPTLWNRYRLYVSRVRAAKIGFSGLRARDRYLWGKSFALGLEDDMRRSFSSSTIAWGS